MLPQIKLFSIGFITFIALDYLWMGIIVRKIYANALGSLAREHMVLWSAVVSYALLLIGIVFFVLPKFSQGQSLISVFFWGALYGLTVYGIYEFVNYAVIQDWPMTLVVCDTLWGGVVCGLVTSVIWLTRS